MQKYSVLMSLYKKRKNPEYLDLAIESMINQTLKPDEIVIVKDGEITAELQGVLDNYSAEYPELFHIVGYAKKQRIRISFKLWIRACRNELVARMDTDDISKPQRCEKTSGSV